MLAKVNFPHKKYIKKMLTLSGLVGSKGTSSGLRSGDFLLLRGERDRRGDLDFFLSLLKV